MRPCSSRPTSVQETSDEVSTCRTKPSRRGRLRLACQAVGVLYLVTLTLFLVHSDAFALFGYKAKVVEARMDATFSGFLQHLGAYFMLGSLLICGFGGTFASPGSVHAFVFVHACATELLQAFVPQRTSDWRDLLANGIGVVLATAACTFVASRSLRKTSGPAAVLLLLVAACGCTDTGIEERSQPPTEQATAPAHSRTPEESVQAKLIRSTDWIGSGEWIKVDTHCHTRFSDGEHSIEEVVVKASEYGCDAVAITDHIDRLDREDIPPYLEAIDVARRQFPEILILVGLEWNGMCRLEAETSTQQSCSPPLAKILKHSSISANFSTITDERFMIRHARQRG